MGEIFKVDEYMSERRLGDESCRKQESCKGSYRIKFMRINFTPKCYGIT